jgi:hypothetical protein
MGNAIQPTVKRRWVKWVVTGIAIAAALYLLMILYVVAAFSYYGI